MATLDDDETRAPLELFGAVAYEARPVPGSGDELTQRRQHLAAIAHAERERLGAREELGELLAQLGIEQDRFRPALAGPSTSPYEKPPHITRPLNSASAARP
jgi:hypothetical protein